MKPQIHAIAMAGFVLAAFLGGCGTGTSSDHPATGTVFRDCDGCPEMVGLPSGSFMMGSDTGSREERPVHWVRIPKPLAIGKFEVTFDEWDLCVAEGACSHRAEDSGWGRGDRPVVDVNWYDAQEYVSWLTQKTGKPYRLPSEAEWEYAARAGTTSKYWWGNAVGVNNANCQGCGSPWDGRQTAPVGSFGPNPNGIYDTQGNAAEWVQDCAKGGSRRVSSDSAAWEPDAFCLYRVLRGGSWGNSATYIRSAARMGYHLRVRLNTRGFRVALSLD